MASTFTKPPSQPTKTYRYDPHLDPALQWAGKAERTSFEVDTVSLHIHERISTEAILRAARREPPQRSIEGEPLRPGPKEIDFYAHDGGWSNRMVLGDSLLVMNSLLEREHMAGQVQCIYMDPPYGVKFNSNFQSRISRREVKDGDDESLTREPEQIKAYRDTWTLGIHSYLTYMRDRLLLARELLSDSGSIFVQISDENVHHVRELADEVFGREHCVTTIILKKKGATTSTDPVNDFIVWYAKNRDALKVRTLYQKRSRPEDDSRFNTLLGPQGELVRVASLKGADDVERLLSRGYEFARVNYPLVSQHPSATRSKDFVWNGKSYGCGESAQWRFDPETDMHRLAASGRLFDGGGKSLGGIVRWSDWPFVALSNMWNDLHGDQEPMYVVQTNRRAVQRCLLMTTDPGDLVLDPTCGSGTTAFVAEQWGRRWVTCDTSRVALAIARQRMLTSKFLYYRLRSNKVRDGFIHKPVPHVTLRSIAQNRRLDSCKNREDREKVIRESADPEELPDLLEDVPGRIRVAGPFTMEAIPVAVLDTGDASPIAADYIGMMIDLLKKTGVQFQRGKGIGLSKLRPVKGPYEYLHAESELKDPADPRRVAVSFGPRHAPVTPVQVRDAIAETRGYDIVLFVGFACDPEARRIIDAGVRGRDLQFVAAAPDILVADLLKTTKATKLFTVFGKADVKVHRGKDEGAISVELAAIDLYDPNTGETHEGKGTDVAAWFIDHDYDGKTFCVSQALFPGGATKNPWEKLQKALKGTIDEEQFEALRGTRSLPFNPGKKVAVTVIDDRGNEVFRIVDPRGETSA
jgi:adenine-specific DNA-methyltransferase